MSYCGQIGFDKLSTEICEIDAFDYGNLKVPLLNCHPWMIKISWPLIRHSGKRTNYWKAAFNCQSHQCFDQTMAIFFLERYRKLSIVNSALKIRIPMQFRIMRRHRLECSSTERQSSIPLFIFIAKAQKNLSLQKPNFLVFWTKNIENVTLIL